MPSWRRLRNYFTGRADRDLARELRNHLDLEAEEKQQSGLPPERARHAARRAFGNTTLIKEDTRTMWDWNWLEKIAREIQFALRTMRRRPGFTAVAVLSLGIGLGANTAIFSFVNAIVLKTLPVPGADRLVMLRQQNEMFHIENCCFPYAFFRELRGRLTVFEDMLVTTTAEVTFTDREQTERLRTEIVSGNYFSMLGVAPAVGRLIDEADDRTEGGAAVCVISHDLWRERFGGQPDIVGRRVLINEEPFQVVGVARRPFSGAALHQPHDIFIPASMAAVVWGQDRDSFGWAQLIARRKPGVSVEQAESELNVIGKEVQKITGPKMSERDAFLLRDGSQGISSRKEQFGTPVLMLLLLVGVVLLAACANLAALLLVSSAERTREAAVRVALGASRPALLRQFLTESVLLALAGGAAGWWFSRFLVQTLLAYLGPRSEGVVRHVQPDGAVFAYSAAVTLASGLLLGILPAWRAARTDPRPALHGAVSGGRRRLPMASNLVVSGQIALSLALLFCAGLFAQTVRHLRAIDLGFSPENLVMLRVDLNHTAHQGDRAGHFFDQLLRQAREMPATRAASLSSLSVLSGSMASIVLRIPGYESGSQPQPVSYFTTISNGYFRTLGIPLLAGRDFIDSDREGGEGAVIVNEQFARQYLGGDALDKTFAYGGGRRVRVVGVVGTTKFRWLREDPQPVMYVPVTQWRHSEALFLNVRTSGRPAEAIERISTLARNLDPGVPLGEITTMETQIDHALARERLLSFLSSLLGLVALTLTAIGLYGVLSYSVARRTRELGVRLAVGAQRRQISMLILRDSIWMLVGGIAAGILLAFACGRLASSLIFGLQAQDGITALGATAALAIVAVVASLLPAIRAARLDPVTALRYE